MKKIVLLITIQILCMHSFVVNAQRIFSTSYTMDDGLAANRVYSILQDSCGFMWFGTDDGLSRFDGIAFKNYYLSEYINATTSNSVKKIFIDRRGRMWIGLDTGIVIYDSKTDTFQPFHAKTETGEMIQTYVTDMIEDSDGEVWIATSGEGLYRFSPSDKVRLRVYRNIPGKINSISQNIIMTLQQDSKQNIWIGTYSEGLCCFDKQKNTFVTYKKSNHPNSLSDNSIQKVFEDSHGNLWIGTFQNGLDLFDPVAKTFTNYRDRSPNNLLYHIHDIKEYRPGELFISSDNGMGIFKADKGEIIQSDNPNLKIRTGANKFIYTIYIDKEESLWLGSYFDGIKFYSAFQNNFKYYSCSSSSTPQSGKVINVIKEDKDDKYWIGTDDNGIFRFDAKTQEITPFRDAASIGTTYYCIHDLLVDGDKLYAATYGRGLEVIDLKTGKVESFLNNPEDSTSIPSSRVFTLYKASNGCIYVGTSAGFCYYNPEKNNFIRIGSFTGKISDIIEDYFGRIWIGTSISGLYSYNVRTQKITSYQRSDHPNSLTKNVITTLAIDNKKRLWVGTYGQGLCRYNDETEAFTKIISNLLSNALKYAKSTIRITTIEKDSEIVVTVTDDGIGITDQEKTKIFDAFYQVKNNSEINKLGIGIGLHMTRSLVQLMNGKIEVSDREGGENGVSISVYFPKQAAITALPQVAKRVEDTIIPENSIEENELESTLPGEPLKKQYAIMVVDDNPEILDFLSKILSEEYFVISASSGEEALQILEKNNIDLIISDVMMEEMDGFELCGKIKSNINISHVPVILLTAKTDTESKIKGLEAGADAYIEKPFSPFHLKAQLLNLLKKRESQQKTYASTPLSDLHSAVHNKLDEEFMNKCTEIIQNNIEDSEFSVNTLAQELGMSRTSVFTKIKGIIGMTPNDFIKVTRLKKACKMMVEGEYRVTEIGFLVGFSSSSYFAKCFQKQFGMLPTEFLKKIKEDPSSATK